MSDADLHNHDHDHDRDDRDAPAPEGTAKQAAGAPPRRAASVTLASGTRQDSTAALMDPANQSLAEALRISFRIIQLAMVVLAALFVFSGFQTVEENEKGIRVTLGRKAAGDLEPGPHFAAPYPIGELVKVQTGVNDVVVSAFFPNAANKAQDPAQTLQAGGGTALNPTRDGSILTADLNLAHAWWTAQYRRDRPAQYAEHVLPDAEAAIVELLLQRAAVHTLAQTPIESVLKGESGDITRRVEENAQAALDALAAGEPVGISIDRVDLNHRGPPTSLVSRFNAVLNARSQGGVARRTAQTKAAGTLSEAAGRAAETLVAAIDAYEAAVETSGPDAAEPLLKRIDEIMTAGAPDAPVGGSVSELLSRAENTRFALVSDAEADARLFLAKAEQFEANALLMVYREWADGLQTFLAKDFVQSMMTLPGQTIELLVNEDPDIARELEKARNRAESQRAIDEREKQFQQQRFRTQTGIQRDED